MLFCIFKSLSRFATILSKLSAETTTTVCKTFVGLDWCILTNKYGKRISFCLDWVKFSKNLFFQKTFFSHFFFKKSHIFGKKDFLKISFSRGKKKFFFPHFLEMHQSSPTNVLHTIVVVLLSVLDKIVAKRDNDLKIQKSIICRYMYFQIIITFRHNLVQKRAETTTIVWKTFVGLD